MATMILPSRSRGLQDILANPVSFIKQSTPFSSAPGEKHTPVNREQASSFKTAATSDRDITLPIPSRELFPKDKLSTRWSKVWPVLPGLQNTGNFCYMNSVLQCLLHTPPMVEYLLSGEHEEECRANRCIVCAITLHGVKAYSENRKGSFLPKDILQHLKVIAKHFQIYRQEDAHEFLRLLIDAMQNSLLYNYKNLDYPAQQTTFIHRIFGGYLKQIVTCLSCCHKSETVQTVLDLSLDIHGRDIHDSLLAFTTPEKLSREVKFKCEKCLKLVEAEKHTQIHTAPQILTLHLKRFTSYSSKISHYVRFPETLDLEKYIVSSRRESHLETKYLLYSVIVHSGGGTRSGHYFAFCKGSADVWHEFDDDHVVTAKAAEVLQQQAYILLYKRVESSSLKKSVVSSASTPPLLSSKKLSKSLPFSVLDQQQPTPSPTPPPNVLMKSLENHKKRKYDDTFNPLNKCISSFNYFGSRCNTEDEGRKLKRKDCMKTKS